MSTVDNVVVGDPLAFAVTLGACVVGVFALWAASEAWVARRVRHWRLRALEAESRVELLQLEIDRRDTPVRVVPAYEYGASLSVDNIVGEMIRIEEEAFGPSYGAKEMTAQIRAEDARRRAGNN